jgi:hypothetical protein
LLSKLVILFSLSALQTLSYVVIGNLILEVKGMTFAFWLILFSTSCFANVMGLNISSAFRSAVTVYVLIPLLLIPQMILSGLLFSFDKLNDLISTRGKVPVVADFMASRWAYEAMAVYQFTQNEYEAPFYEYERAQSNADFKAGSLADELSRRNRLLLENIPPGNDSIKADLNIHLQVIRRELEKEPFREGLDKFNPNEALTLTGYTPEIGQRLEHYFDEYRKHYQKIYNTNVALMEKKMAYYEKEGFSINQAKNDYYNEDLADLVQNALEKDRVLEFRGELIQQIDPIFQTIRPENVADYRTAFFLPEKNLLGARVGTFWFNALIIWLMSTFLYTAVYFEWLRRLVDYFSRVNFPKRK